MVAQYTPEQGDILFMDFDPQTGHEQKGRRPALVVSNYSYNKHTNFVMVCPITNQNKGHLFHIALDDRTVTTGMVLSDQVRALDLSKRRSVFKEKAPSDLVDRVVALIASFMN